MIERIGCKECKSPNCKGCNMLNLERMLNSGKLDCLMDDNRTIHGNVEVEPAGKVEELMLAMSDMNVKFTEEKLAFLKLIKELAEYNPRWIPVTERLPEENHDGTVNAVLVTDGFVQHMSYFARGEWRFAESGEMKEPMWYRVTHWMPLPQAPEDGGNNDA